MVMKLWIEKYFTDSWVFPDLLESAQKFISGTTSTDDPPETVPISVVHELKGILEATIQVCNRNFLPRAFDFSNAQEV
jgi:hypothetical protein